MDLFHIITTLWVVGNSMLFLIFLPLITYLYHSKFGTLFSYLGKHKMRQPLILTHSMKENDYHIPKKISSIKEALFWSILLFSVLFLFGGVSFIDVLLVSHEENAFLDVNHHLMRTPYMNCNSTIYISYILYAVEQPFSMCTCLTYTCQCYFITMITIELHNIAVDYCQDLQHCQLQEYDGLSKQAFNEHYFSSTAKKLQIIRQLVQRYSLSNWGVSDPSY